MRQARDVEPEDAAARGYATRPPESATFEAARIGGGRRPPLFAVGFVMLVGGMVAVGIAGRAPVEPPAVAGTSIDPGPLASSPVLPVVSIAPSPDSAPVVTNGEGPIVLQARRHPETIYVHGDVFVDQVTWVFVSLQDQAGRIAGWASVSIPGGSAGPAASGVPTLRFDVELALPRDMVDGPLRIHASAHDTGGRLVATARVEMDAEGNDASAATSAAWPIGGGAEGFLTRSSEGGWPPLRVTGFGTAPVSLVLPSPSGAVTTAFVAVQGTVRGRPDAVRIVLETSDEHPLGATIVDAVMVDTHNVHGGIRPDRTPTVDVRLALPRPRPVAERLWICITAYDELGRPQGTMRRPVDIGPLTKGGG